MDAPSPRRRASFSSSGSLSPDPPRPQKALVIGDDSEVAVEANNSDYEEDESESPAMLPTEEEEGKTLVDFESLSVSGTFEVFEEEEKAEALPFDSSRIRGIISGRWGVWEREAALGGLGETLFAYYCEVEGQSIDFTAMEKETIELVAGEQGSVGAGDFRSAFALFANLHRFYAMLCERPFYVEFTEQLAGHVTASFEWLIGVMLPIVLENFKTICVCDLGENDAQIAVTKIVQFRSAVDGKLGDFVWAHLLKAIDCELANQLVDEAQFRTIAEMEFAKTQFEALESIIQVSMPFFMESINFVTSYEMIIRQSIPFENYRLHLPPDFIVALVFMAKRKGLVPLEISDRRILKFAEYMKVDITKVTGDTFLFVDESVTAVPITLWDASGD